MFLPKSYPRGQGLSLAALLMCFGFSSLEAALLLNEPFSYPAGPLVTVSGGVWATHSGTAGQVQVLSGRANLSAALTEDVNVPLAGQPYPATASTVVYAGFTVNFAALPSAGGDYFVHLKDTTGSNFRAKLFALTSGAGAGQFLLGIANGTNTVAAVTHATSLKLNTDYRVYLRYVINSAMTTLWVDPAAEDSPSVTATDLSPVRAVVALAFRETSGIGALAVDDLQVGTTFADVYVVPPQVSPVITQSPTSKESLQGGTVTFAVVATGTGPLGYQWMFGTNALAGATNATLTITHVDPSEAGQYSVTVSNSSGAATSAAAMLTVIAPSANGLLKLVTYNVKGNFAADWTTNAPQVQAIARELQYLDPDIITLNEIPNGFRYEMTNWMMAFFPTRSLAVSPGTDGTIRSGVISRYPIARSQSWLDGASLTNFGYNGTFTRDLFEAEIPVPGATEPVHVFTTHLKSGSDADSQDRRAAEASAVSNFFATVFQPTYGQRPYVLTGDLNEDIDQPYGHNNQPIQRLVAAPTGLHYTTPVNPFTLSPLTHSIQSTNGLDQRFDYIFPAGVLASNIVMSEVFRTDLLPAPPPPLLADDGATASDHLPVVMVFNYPDPPLQVAMTVSNSTLVLRWPALIGRSYQIEASGDLANWSVVASNWVALSSEQTWSASAAPARQFYRIGRVP